MKERIKLLRRLLDLFESQKNEISQLITKEVNKPISQSTGEIDFFNIFNHWVLDNVEDIIKDKIVFEDEGSIHKLIYEPLGKVAVILPWNSPYGLFSWKLFSNLAVGNTIIVKHSKYCSNISKYLEKLIIDLGYSQDTVKFIYGEDQEGEELVRSDIDAICFTGSSETGEKIFNAPKRHFPKMIMELGGSNPAIIFEDANISEATDLIFSSRFSNNGQNCDAVKRLIVHESKYVEVVEDLTKKLIDSRVGEPNNSDTFFGPLCNSDQFKLAKEQLDDAINKGAKILATIDSPSTKIENYLPPVILGNIDTNMRIWTEETFCPILPIVKFNNEQEAISLANDTKYGLGAKIFTKNVERIDRIAHDLKCGNIEVNNTSQWKPQIPFGGYKQSGIGRENGEAGLMELCQIKIVSQQKKNNY